MRVMVLVKATEISETETADPEWTRSMLAEMGRFNHELERAGVLLAAEGLRPTSCAKRVAFDGTLRTVIDGPFAETGALVAGYWLWEVQDMDEAIDWAKRAPNPMPVPSELEIRPLYE
jgi:hypothetical protein